MYRREGGRRLTHTEDNALSDLAYAHMAVRKLKQYSAAAKQPIKPEWLALENQLVAFPLVQDRLSRDNKTVRHSQMILPTTPFDARLQSSFGIDNDVVPEIVHRRASARAGQRPRLQRT